MAKDLAAHSFGQRLRKLREAEGLTVAELASRLNLKPAYLEKLERDAILPPVAEIITIARHLSVEPSSFMSGRMEDAGAPPEKRKKAVEERTRDYAYQLLTRGGPDDHLMAFLVNIDPHSYHKKVAYRHEGEEFVYVLSGKLVITVDRKASSLGAGGVIHFDSGKKHLLRNPGKDPTRLLVVIYHP